MASSEIPQNNISIMACQKQKLAWAIQKELLSIVSRQILGAKKKGKQVRDVNST